MTAPKWQNLFQFVLLTKNLYQKINKRDQISKLRENVLEIESNKTMDGW